MFQNPDKMPGGGKKDANAKPAAKDDKKVADKDKGAAKVADKKAKGKK